MTLLIASFVNAQYYDYGQYPYGQNYGYNGYSNPYYGAPFNPFNGFSYDSGRGENFLTYLVNL